MVENANDLFPPVGGDNKKTEKAAGKEKPAETVKPSQTTPVVNQQEELEKMKELLAESKREMLELKNLFQNVAKQGMNVGPNSNDLGTAIKLLAENSTTKTQSRVDQNAYMNPDLLDKEDYLESPELFYAYSTFFVIGDDKRQGLNVQSPAGPITFVFHTAQTLKQGKGDQIINTSVYRSHSKKVSKWLRDHSKFGVKFFEWSSVENKTDYDKVTKLMRFADSLSSTSASRLMALCGEHGIEFNPDNIHGAKIALIMKMTEDEIKREGGVKDDMFNLSKLNETKELVKANALAAEIDARGY